MVCWCGMCEALGSIPRHTLKRKIKQKTWENSFVDLLAKVRWGNSRLVNPLFGQVGEHQVLHFHNLLP